MEQKGESGQPLLLFEWRFAGGPMVARHFVLAGKLYANVFKSLKNMGYNTHRIQQRSHRIIVGEPKSRILQKHTFFAPERYTAGILYTDSLNGA